MSNENLCVAVNYFGSKSKLARALDITPQRVNKWRHNKVPAEWAKKIEEVTKGNVKREQIRPDIFS